MIIGEIGTSSYNQETILFHMKDILSEILLLHFASIVEYYKMKLMVLE